MLATYLLKHFLQIFVLVFLLCFSVQGLFPLICSDRTGNCVLQSCVSSFLFLGFLVSLVLWFCMPRDLISGNFLCSPPQPQSLSSQAPSNPTKAKSTTKQQKKGLQTKPKGGNKIQRLGSCNLAVLFFCWFCFMFCNIESCV